MRGTDNGIGGIELWQTLTLNPQTPWFEDENKPKGPSLLCLGFLYSEGEMQTLLACWYKL